MHIRFNNILDASIIFLIKGLIFFLPLFFLPFTFDFFEFNKEYLLCLIVPIIFILWILKLINNGKKIIIKKTFLDIPILIFLFIAGISSIFSIDKFSSFFGWYGEFSGAWLGLLSFILFYFLIINFSADNKINIFSLLLILMYSYCISLALFFLSFLGLFDFLYFSATGPRVELFAIYSSIMAIMLSGFLIFYWQKGRDNFNFWFFNLVLFLSLASLAIINFFVAWIALFTGGLIFLLAILRQKSKKVVIPLILLILSLSFLILLFLGINTNLENKIIGRDFPHYARLGYKDATNISFNALKDNLALGSGPSTFSYDFSIYRSPNLNKSDFWQFRFNKAPSYIIESLGTFGILGFLSYFLIIIISACLAFVFIKKSFLASNQKILLITSSILLILILVQFLYSSSILFLFLFWIFLAFILIAGEESGLFSVREIILNFKNKIFLCFFISIIFLLFIGWIFLASFEIKCWLADFYAFRGGEENLIKATQLNSNYCYYRVKLSKYYLNKINSETIKNPDFRNNSESLNLIEYYIGKSIESAQAGVVSQPNSVVCRENLGMIYRDIGSLASGSEFWAVKAFKEATALESSNPVLLTELGKAYIAANMIGEAVKSLEKAVEFKSDYYEAKFSLARAYIKIKREKDALALLDELSFIYSDPEIYYEQGRLYYNQGDIEKAIDKFIEAIKLSPNHSNSLYSLGLALELKGEKIDALKYFKKVLELNPSNSIIENKIIEFNL